VALVAAVTGAVAVGAARNGSELGTAGPATTAPGATTADGDSTANGDSNGGSTSDGATGPTPGSPSTPTSTTAAATTTTEPTGPASVTLAFSGDVLPHMPLNDRAADYGAESGAAFDYRPMFEPMAPVIEPVDVAICHMEVPLAPRGEAITSYPSFGAPPEIVEGPQAAGYDGCTTASNHSLDRGRAGLDHLLDRFDEVGMSHNGTARNPEEGGGTATVYEVDGVRIANLSYAYDFNGYHIPADAPWSVNKIDPEAIFFHATRARNEGADLVVVSLHWGDEYVHEPSAYQRDVADQLLPSDEIDLIVGHHAHVVQPIEQVEGTWVVWGLGNQVSNQPEEPRRDGLTVVVTAERDPGGDGWEVADIEAVPTWVDLATYRILPVVATLADPETPDEHRVELSGSYDRTASVVADPLPDGVTLAPKP
jgi:poly-gamma-glutamate synthesis protein (capsule biosynthesis protein)